MSNAARPAASGLTQASVRESLIAATSAAHAALHQAEPFAAIARGTLDLAGYADLLQAFQRFHLALAPLCHAGCVVIAMPDLFPSIAGRMDRLRRDLAHLRVPVENAPSAGPDCATDSFSVGCLYTVAGSALGARVLYRQLQYLLPTTQGREFFGAGPADGAIWHGFCERLEEHGRSGGRLPEIHAGARYAFDLFRTCIEARR